MITRYLFISLDPANCLDPEPQRLPGRTDLLRSPEERAGPGARDSVT